MKKITRWVLSWVFSIVGSLLAVYVAGYLLLAKSIYWCVTAFSSGTMNLRGLIISLIKICIAATVGGAIWCIFDIIAGKFRDYPYEQ